MTSQEPSYLLPSWEEQQGRGKEYTGDESQAGHTVGAQHMLVEGGKVGPVVGGSLS